VAQLVDDPKVLGAHVECLPLIFAVGMDPEPRSAAFGLTRDARLYVNSRTIDRVTIHPSGAQEILEHCRRLGIWIVAGRCLRRLCSAAGAAALRSRHCAEGDRLVSTNMFSNPG